MARIRTKSGEQSLSQKQCRPFQDMAEGQEGNEVCPEHVMKMELEWSGACSLLAMICKLCRWIELAYNYSFREASTEVLVEGMQSFWLFWPCWWAWAWNRFQQQVTENQDEKRRGSECNQVGFLPFHWWGGIERAYFSIVHFVYMPEFTAKEIVYGQFSCAFILRKYFNVFLKTRGGGIGISWIQWSTTVKILVISIGRLDSSHLLQMGPSIMHGTLGCYVGGEHR